MTAPQNTAAAAADEGRFHTYASSVIPWYVRLLWIAFWILATAYLLRWLLPALPHEVLNPP